VSGARSGTFVDPPLDRALVRGFVDLHVHTGPDVFGRALDDDEAALGARRANTALVFKNHVAETASRAELVARRHGVEAWGGVVLNRATGGLNPHAVDALARIEGGRGRIVWLPTIDARNHRRTLDGVDEGIDAIVDGRPTGELEAVVRACAARGLALATGHTSADDVVVVAELCRDAGVRCCVTHGLFPIVGCTDAHLERLAELGALVELCAVGTLMGEHAHLPWMRAWGKVDAATCAGIVARFGPERFIVSTDLGQSGNPTPSDGLLRFVAALRAEGLDEGALRTLGVDNPRRLLGL
jgi:hypothetical protein